MRTNIDINDDLMAAAMEAGGFSTKREAVEEGLRLLSRRKVYEGLLALRGQLQWDDSDAGWALAQRDASGVQEPETAYVATPAKRGKAVTIKKQPRTPLPASARSKST